MAVELFRRKGISVVYVSLGRSRMRAKGRGEKMQRREIYVRSSLTVVVDQVLGVHNSGFGKAWISTSY